MESVFAIGAVSFAAASALTVNARRGALTLWLSGLCSGTLYLLVGAEALALVQWVVSTLTAMALIFYAVMFGVEEKLDRAAVVRAILPAVSGLCFALFVVAGVVPGGGWARMFQFTPSPTAASMESLGAQLLSGHLLSLEIFSVTLLLVVVGAGMIARPEIGEKMGESAGGSR